MDITTVRFKPVCVNVDMCLKNFCYGKERRREANTIVVMR